MSLARPKFVKKANKDNPVCKKGESYWYWSSFRGPKQFSKERPKESQLESNETTARAYSAQEGLENEKPTSVADLEGIRDNLVSELEETRDEAQEKYDNMPEQFQEGDTGQNIQSFIDAMDEWISNLKNVDLEETDEGETEEEKDEAKDQQLDDLFQELIDAKSDF